MNRTWLVAQREYVDNVRTRTFWIGIFSLPVILTLAMVVPTLLEGAKDARRYAVIDRSGWLMAAVEERAVWDDTLRLMQLVQEKSRDGETAGLPATLHQLATLVQDRSLEELEEMARFMAAMGLGSSPGSTPDLDDLPPEVRREMAEQASELIAWQLTLSPEEARQLEAGIKRENYEKVEIPAGEGEDWARDALDREELFAYFVIGTDPVTAPDAKYVSNNRTDTDLREWVERLADTEVRARRFAAEGIAPEVAERIQAPFEFVEKQVTEAGETEVEATDVLRQWAPLVFVYLLWLSVFTVAQMLLTNTVEEKSNRVIEVLLSSVSPLELLTGKIAGIAATGLTVIGSWIVFFLLLLKYLPVLLGAPLTLDLTILLRDPAFLASFVAYFLLGYLLYATLLVGIGAVTNSLKEAQNLMQPLMIVLIVPLVAMVPVGRDPNGALARILSWIPPFTPFIMMNRAAGPPSPFEYVATTVLLLVTIAASSWAAARIFRIGILMTGKPPALKEIWRWVRTPAGGSATTAIRRD